MQVAVVVVVVRTSIWREGGYLRSATSVSGGGILSSLNIKESVGKDNGLLPKYTNPSTNSNNCT